MEEQLTSDHPETQSSNYVNYYAHPCKCYSSEGKCKGIHVIPHNKPHKRFTWKNTGVAASAGDRSSTELRGRQLYLGLLRAELSEGRYLVGFQLLSLGQTQELM